MLKNIDESKAVKAMSQIGLSIDDIRKYIAYMGLDIAKAEESIALLGITGTKSITSIGTAIKGFFLTPLGKATAALLVAGATFLALEGLVTSSSEAVEKMATSFSEFEEAKQKVSDLNNELKTARTRINELEAKGGLTFVEKDELNNLRESVRLLQIQKDLAEQETATKAKQAAEAASDSYDKNFRTEISKESTASYASRLTLFEEPASYSHYTHPTV